jgi:hypothetical protein
LAATRPSLRNFLNFFIYYNSLSILGGATLNLGAHYSGLLPSALRVITKVMLKIIPDDFGGHSAISPKLFNFDCLLNPSIKA